MVTFFFECFWLRRRYVFLLFCYSYVQAVLVYTLGINKYLLTGKILYSIDLRLKMV
jgi:hypothetical protein